MCEVKYSTTCFNRLHYIFLSRLHCLSWKSAKCEWVMWQNRQSCRVHYQWNACQYLARKWVSPWCVLCH